MEPDARPASTEVSDDTPIWKYMDLPKFFATLYKRKLWFAKASTFHDDPWEGFGSAKCLKDSPEETWPTTPGETHEVSWQSLMAHFSQRSAHQINNARSFLYINSWCWGPESMAMWEIYGSHASGVALKSSVGQYKRAAKWGVESSYYDFAPVTYHPNLELVKDLQLDFRGATPVPGLGTRRTTLKLGRHKRECFQYEQEWRALLCQDEEREEAGIDVVFDLDDLISEICVGPRADVFLVETVKSIMDTFKLTKPCKRSDLLGPPRREEAPTG
jgi:hypothetical protein